MQRSQLSWRKNCIASVTHRPYLEFRTATYLVTRLLPMPQCVVVSYLVCGYNQASKLINRYPTGGPRIEKCTLRPVFSNWPVEQYSNRAYPTWLSPLPPSVTWFVPLKDSTSWDERPCQWLKNVGFLFQQAVSFVHASSGARRWNPAVTYPCSDACMSDGP